MYRYEIQRGDNGYVAYIYNDTDLLIIQPFSPETGKPFVTEEEAKSWAEDFISLMIPPDVIEEPTEEGAEPVETSSAEATTTETTTTTESTENATTESSETTTTTTTAEAELSQTTTTAESTAESSETSTTTDTNTASTNA